jgi:hypothetical protein
MAWLTGRRRDRATWLGWSDDSAWADGELLGQLGRQRGEAAVVSALGQTARTTLEAKPWPSATRSLASSTYNQTTCMAAVRRLGKIGKGFTGEGDREDKRIKET